MPVGNQPELVANAVLIGPWIDVSGSGDVQNYNVQVLADQVGTLVIYESETKTGLQSVIGGVTIVPNIPHAFSGVIGKRFVRFGYTNGAIGQGVFNLTLSIIGQPPLDPSNNNARCLDLILRELRVQSLILAALKEPGPLNITMPFGPANSTT